MGLKNAEKLSAIFKCGIGSIPLWVQFGWSSVLINLANIMMEKFRWHCTQILWYFLGQQKCAQIPTLSQKYRNYFGRGKQVEKNDKFAIFLLKIIYLFSNLLLILDC